MNVPLAFRSLVRELDRALEGCRTVLEIGCGVDSPTRFIAHQYEIEGLDVYEPALRAGLEKGFLKKGHLADARHLDRLFPEKSFDAVIGLDLIEHLPKDEGEALVEKILKVARKRVVLFTPNGFVPQAGDSNPWMEHKSGWDLADFRQLGFQVVGVNGWKVLRGEKAMLRYRPRLMWGAISELTHYLYTRNHPEQAFALFAVYRFGSETPKAP